MICYKHLNFCGKGFAININLFKILYKKQTNFLIATILISLKPMTTKTIPFHELVPGSEGVRFTTVEGTPFMSVRDIIMVVCEKDANHASQTWRELSASLKDELNQFLVSFQFPGRGQSLQPVIMLPGALKLVMWLPGKIAKEYRTKVCEILTRYLAGDASLIAEINANAVSTAPINEMARASLPDSFALVDRAVLDRMESKMDAIEQKMHKERDQDLVVLRAKLDHSEHLRHQADGRYGSDKREANKNVRDQANMWRNEVEESRILLREERIRLAECHSVIMSLCTKLTSDRSRSPKRVAADQ